MNMPILGVAIAASFILGGCSKSCDSLAADLREKTADTMHAAVDAYSAGSSPDKVTGQLLDAQGEVMEIRSEMEKKGCPIPLGI